MNPPWIRTHKHGVILAIKVQPRASKSEIVGILGNELKIRIAAPPIDSAANEALVEFIAEKSGCHRQTITLIRGATSRSKTLSIRDGKLHEIEKKLLQGENR
ncbi:MAG: hypothetical protein JWM99_5205 [Verrucomicrobiales bacterium]|nr:hypothetical protein [Verrucomicrobiales bacterium]